MRFFERPFVILAPLFIIGILLGDTFDWSNWMLIPVFAVVAWTFVRYKAKKSDSNLFYLVTIAGFIFCGFLSIRTERSTYSITSNGDYVRSFVGEITEIDESKRLWVRSIFTITGVVEENSIRAHNEKIVCYVNAPNLELHDKLYIRKEVYAIKNRHNPGEFNSKSYWHNKGVHAAAFITEGDYKVINKLPTPFLEKWRSSAKRLFENIFSYHFEGDALAIASALILGDKALLSQDLRDSFGAAGAMHVLAVSGLHVGIILELLLFLFGRIPKVFTKKRALIISLIILWLYAMIIGFPPSVVRATLMFSVLSIGRMSSQQSDSLNILFFTAFAMLVFEPLLIYDIGFQLSYLAMLGILTVQKTIASMIYIKNKWLRKLWDGTSVGIAAQLFTFPLTLYYFHQFPNYFLLTNIGMMVFAGIVLSLGIILLSINWISFLGKLIAVGFGFSIAAMLFFVKWIEGLPGALADGFVLNPWVVLASYIVLFGILIFRKNQFALKIAIGCGLILIAFIQFDRHSKMSTKEIILFNSSQLIIAVKDETKTTFFYSSAPSQIEKIEFLGRAYLKANSAKGKFVRLRRGITKYESDQLKMTFDMSNLGVLVTRFPDNMQFYVRTTNSAPYLENMKNFSMNYLPVTSDAIGLDDGAYSMPLLPKSKS